MGKLIFFVLALWFRGCWGIRGVVLWREAKEFQPIFNIDEFFNYEKTLDNISLSFVNLTNRIPLRFSKLKEAPNFNLSKIYLSYFEDPDTFHFYDNDTKATGILGDIWTLLEEYLNFTMILKRTDTRIGYLPENQTHFTGLLGEIQDRKFDVVPKVEMFPLRINAVDFSTFLWKDKHALFMSPDYHFKLTWMLDVFSGKIWFSIVLFFFLLSGFSVFFQLAASPKDLRRHMSSYTDHLFYNFGALCNQGDILYLVHKNCKILTFCISAYAWILTQSYSSQLFIISSQSVTIKPFRDLESLFTDTTYTILAAKDSIVDTTFRKFRDERVYKQFHITNRIRFYENYTHIWQAICANKEMYVAFQSVTIKMDNFSDCRIEPVGITYWNTEIGSGIVKDFEHREYIDRGILKLHEVGLIDGLKDRWLKSANDKSTASVYAPISLDEVFLPIGIFLLGLTFSVVFLFIENLVFWCEVKKKSKKK